jgi:hypothetical protein
MCDAALAILKTRDDESMICVFLYVENVSSVRLCCVSCAKRKTLQIDHTCPASPVGCSKSKAAQRRFMLPLKDHGGVQIAKSLELDLNDAVELRNGVYKYFTSGLLLFSINCSALYFQKRNNKGVQCLSLRVSKSPSKPLNVLSVQDSQKKLLLYIMSALRGANEETSQQSRHDALCEFSALFKTLYRRNHGG